MYYVCNHSNAYVCFCLFWVACFLMSPYKFHNSTLTNMVCASPPSSLFPILPPYHPGDGCIAKWSRSSCITEDTAGTATTASPAPAVTRSCLMEPVLSWTSTPLKMTTCWMGMLPPQVGITGSTGYQLPTLTSPDLLCLSIPWFSWKLLIEQGKELWFRKLLH